MKNLPAQRVLNEPFLKLRSKFMRVIFGFMLFYIFFTGAGFLYIFYGGFLPLIVQNPLTMMLLLYFLSFSLASILGFYVSRHILAPIEELSKASQRVAKGDFSVRIPDRHNTEELHNTFSNFNTMVRELSSIETLRNDFITNVSHEFKTPLSAIEGYVTLLQDTSLTDAERLEYTEKILFNTSRLNDLTGNILLLSKLENQSYGTESARYRLDEQIREAILLLEPKWTAKEIVFDLDGLKDTVIVSNEALLLQVWMNMISNAVKFVNQQGTIAISIAPQPDSVVVTVKDNGIGMSEETVRHIFEKFYQADTSHRSEGNGLGLALCKEIIHKLNGKITVASSPGKGSTFTVTIPAGSIS